MHGYNYIFSVSGQLYSYKDVQIGAKRKKNITIHLVKISSKYKLLESVSFTQTTLNNIEYYYLY